MLEFLDTRPDTIALKVAHKITSADLDAIMNRLDPMLAAPGKVHVFVETQAIDAIELAGLPAYIARAMPLFARLNRFGRVAIVADQAWIRAATRIESAMLPFITYRVFEPHQRDEALAWVEGRKG